MGKERQDSDRERVLLNIAASLAGQLASIQATPYIASKMDEPNSMYGRIRAKWYCDDFKPGDLVVCGSAGYKQNPWVLSEVIEVGIPNDPRGALLRAIGTNDLCSYGNESFTKLTGFYEPLLLEGVRYATWKKIHVAAARLGSYIHIVARIQFPANREGVAIVEVRERFGGHHNDGLRSVNYEIEVKFGKRTSVSDIEKQLDSAGFEKRKFDVSPDLWR